MLSTITPPTKGKLMSKLLIALNREIAELQFRYVDAIESDNHETAQFLLAKVEELVAIETKIKCEMKGF